MESSEKELSLKVNRHPDGRICCEELLFSDQKIKQIYAIIPAAGKGKRFGQPKVTATYGEKTFIKHILDTLSGTAIAGVKVVRDVETPDMFASVRQGIKCALADGWLALGWLIWPVDHPLVKRETISSLLSSFWEKPESIVNPVYEGQRGHPIIIPAILEFPDNLQSEGLRTILAQTDLSKLDIEVSDPAVIRNINYPKDILTDV